MKRLMICVGIVAALATMFVGSYVGAQRAQRYSDVPTTHYAYEAIEWATEAGITSGCAGGNFCPEQSLNRAQMMVFLHRYDQIERAAQDPWMRHVHNDLNAVLGSMHRDTWLQICLALIDGVITGEIYSDCFHNIPVPERDPNPTDEWGNPVEQRLYPTDYRDRP